MWLKLKKKEKPVLLKRQQAPGITTEELKKYPSRNTNKIISISYNRTDLPE